MVDTAGRGSRLKKFLADLGAPPVREDIVDAGLTYATKIFRAPEEARAKFPSSASTRPWGDPTRPLRAAAAHRGRPLDRHPLRHPGGEPPSDEEGWYAYARSLRHPILADLIAAAEPLTDIQMSHSTVNRRLYCEHVDPGPTDSW
ncbi:hypothetical protein NKH77_11415 [Streptomyces sp. M19]